MIQCKLAIPDAIANAGFSQENSLAARVKVRGSAGCFDTNLIAKSKNPASFAAANHFPSSPGSLLIKSLRIVAGSFCGYFLTIARKVARFVVLLFDARA